MGIYPPFLHMDQLKNVYLLQLLNFYEISIFGEKVTTKMKKGLI